MPGSVQFGWWKTNGAFSGDNVREFPYSQIYQRVTTKSNTYTVHLRVQALAKRASANSADYTTWTEGKDQVLSEYRGSSLIERYVDPGDPNLPDFAKDIAGQQTLDDYYKFRVVSSKKFNP